MITQVFSSEVKVHNILSIDLDFLSNSLKINNLQTEATKNENEFKFVKKLIDKYRDKLIYIVNHGNIPKILYNELHPTDNDVFSIVNIDHHHDIYYSDSSRRDVLRGTRLFKGIPDKDYTYESDWLYWMGKNWKCIEIDEILNSDSIVDRAVLKHGVKFHFELGSPFNPYNLPILEKPYDYIFVALSPHYVDPESRDYICEYLHIDTSVFDNSEIKEME